jgi:TRAP-type C4-dicarboxylate transport system substrate-binding protein
MKRKAAIITSISVLVFTIFMLLETSSSAFAPKKTTIRLGTLAPRGSSFHKALVEMGEKWRDASGGDIKLIIYPDGTQGGEADMVRLMRARALNAGLFTVVGLSKIDDSVGGLSFMPLTFQSWDEYDYVLEKLSARLEKMLLDKGYVVLFWGDAGWVRFFSNTPAVHPDDFKKLKMFTWAGDSYQVDLMKSLGYNPVPLETADILPGLKTDLIDAIPLPPNQAMLGQCYTVAKHMLDLKWSVLSGGTIIRKDTWDTIDPAIQKQLMEAAAEAGRKIRASARKEDEDSIIAMQKKGLKVQPVSPEIEKAWLQLTNTIYPQIRGKKVPEDIFDEVQRLVKEYRSKGTGK